MTQKHTPDRIWATGTDTTGSWNDHDVRYAPGKPYLLATPAREAAPELLEALEMAQLWLNFDGRFDMQKINAAIAKAKGEEG